MLRRATPVTEATRLRPARGSAPQLVAHRGYPRHYPENSLAGIRAAVAAGATAVEFDVNLSADHRPLVIHDADLRRTAGITGDVRDLSADQLASVEVNETARLGTRFRGTNIPRLRDIVELSRVHPALTFFIDVKRASVRRFGHDVVLDAILADIDMRSPSWVLVSFDRVVVERARARGMARIGWVVESWEQATQDSLSALAPDFAFCAADAVPADVPLPAGPWQWVIYGVDDAATVLALGARGAAFIETDAIGELLAAPSLRAVDPLP